MIDLLKLNEDRFNEAFLDGSFDGGLFDLEEGLAELLKHF